MRDGKRISALRAELVEARRRVESIEKELLEAGITAIAVSILHGSDIWPFRIRLAGVELPRLRRDRGRKPTLAVKIHPAALDWLKRFAEKSWGMRRVGYTTVAARLLEAAAQGRVTVSP